MDISVEGFRRHFAELSDEALLEQPREDLIPAAQACLDEELAARGLPNQSATTASNTAAAAVEESVTVGDFATLPEAEIAQALLEGEGINATLVHQDTTGLQTPASNGIALAVSPGHAARAQAILREGLEQAVAISDEELAAQAEAAGAGLQPGTELKPEDEPA